MTWTDYGIPHVVASDWKGLGYGYGYAVARDNVCVLAEEFVTVRGERSLWFGPDETYRVLSNGQTFRNEASDAFFRLYGADAAADAALVRPVGLSRPETRDLLEGLAAGYNRWIADAGPAGLPEACRGEAWVRPIALDDVKLRAMKLQLLASSLYFAEAIAEAAPPTAGATADAFGAGSGDGSESGSGVGRGTGFENGREPPRISIPTPENLGLGSNAYALGRDATADGRGLLLGNPHFPWLGPERFHELHLTIPGRLDVMGASLLGVPLVLIGFNEHVAWSHTVSTGWRFTLHELKLVPGDPTAYVVDGAVERMEPREVTVSVRGADGVSEERTRTLYVTRYGPVVEGDLADVNGVAVGLPWTANVAYAIQDANAQNDRFLEQFWRMDTATSFDAFVASLDDVLGIPWVNTVAASPDGRVFYGDISVVPNVSDATIQTCNVPLGQATFAAARLPVLDGSRAACDWDCSKTQELGCILPASELPRTERADHVQNSNDSHWLPHPDGPLEGYPVMIGAERAERSGRTRMGYVLLDELASKGATQTDLEAAAFSDRLYYPEIVRDAVVEQVCPVPLAASSSGAVVDLAAGCAALAAWDLKADVDSAGVGLFERFWAKAPKVWATPFDAARPVETPRDYIAADPRVRAALADAVAELAAAGVDPAAPVHEARAVLRGGERIPIHGAEGHVGSPAAIRFVFDPAAGFVDVEHGNSYVQVVTWDEAGPVADAILTYSQSSDPASPHFADQTRLYATKTWVRLPFREADVRAGAVETMELRG